ncbi:acyl-CoA dehydrogenase family protein [Actinophytocola oryzae]|uniref:Alkylation response protein AidB-like acyl-CoA dehydrogenase n=1 Tax=Actinophytocola oryzae TaxID=502181 RepID=A0A4R7V0T5_9PSEU|nr:acyl-CoA dehydrogenase family protein [Actinophytocola oryzae]TDV41016.1 alkylation response protein AidB-like acyl-CoA dehydrogenase [Actinophytocola oryzae]
MSLLHVSQEFDELTRRIDDIAPVLRAEAEKSEALRRPTDEVVRALKTTGVLRIGIPEELGGYEFSPTQVVRAIERLSYHDASVGWAVMALQMVTGCTASYLGAEAVADLYEDVPAGRHAVLAGQGTRLGTAERVDGGYRINGHWGFASGIPLATHIHTAAFCAETGQALVFSFPKEKARLIDNWDVLGLRATHSIDYACEDVYVPATHVFEATTTDNRHGGAIYRMGLVNLAVICHTGWALGVGRRMLDELRSLVAGKTGTHNASVDTGYFHAAYAEAEARYRAARAWAMELWADNEKTLDSGDLLSTGQETLTRLMLNNTTWSVQSVGQTVYQWAATTALRRGDLQRYYRDLNSGTQHITSGPVLLQNCGKALAGLAPDAHWEFLDLVSPKENA